MSALEELLQADPVDLDAIRRFCQDEGIPAELRLRLWRQFLGIDADDSPLGATPDAELDPQIKVDVELLNTRMGTLLSPDVCELLQVALQAFCTQKGIAYCSALCELCGPLLMLKCDVPDAVRFLGAITARFLRFLYFPSDTNSAAALEEGLTALLRLLLQYHAPLLALHLDRYRVPPAVLLRFWSPTLLVRQAGVTCAAQLWDHVFAQAHPLGGAFLGLAVLIAHREAVMECEDTDGIVKVIEGITCAPSALKDLCSSARNMHRQTPPSSLALLAQLINAEDSLNATSTKDRLQAHIVLPITAPDLLDAFRVSGHRSKGALTYIVLDCRAERSFQYARLPTAVHIGPDVGYDPLKFQAMRERFTDAKGSHFCVMGTGKAFPEELNLLTVIAMQFVQGGFEHVAFAEGGFKSCIPDIKADTVEFVRSQEPAKAEARAPLISPAVAQKVDTYAKDARAYLTKGLGNIGSLRTNLGTNLGSLKATSTERFGTLGGFWRRDKDKASSSAGLDEDKGLPDLVRVESPSSNDAAAEGSAQPAATATATTAPAGGAKEVTAQTADPNAFSLGGEDDEDADEFEFLEAASPTAPKPKPAPKAKEDTPPNTPITPPKPTPAPADPPAPAPAPAKPPSPTSGGSNGPPAAAPKPPPPAPVTTGSALDDDDDFDKFLEDTTVSSPSPVAAAQATKAAAASVTDDLEDFLEGL